MSAKALAKSSLAKSAKFDHQKHADRLEELNTQAQAARRVEVALGLYCFELKEIHLQYGQFGKWLAQHRPELARQDKEGNWKPCNSLDTASWMARSALEACGYKIGDYIALLENQFPCAQGNCDSRQLMLLPSEKLPVEFKELREQIFALVDGKSQRQLRQEFKQIEDGKVKRGRLKNSSGLTKEMRETAAELEDEQRVIELGEEAGDTATWLLEVSDANGLGRLDSKVLVKLQEAAQTASGFITQLLRSRSSKPATNGGAQ